MNLLSRPSKVLNMDTDAVIDLTYNAVNNTYAASWGDPDGYMNFATYDADVLHRHIEWNLLEVIEETIEGTIQVTAPEFFYFTAYGDSQLYSAEKLINGDEYVVSWFDNKTGEFGTTNYPTESVNNFTRINGGWNVIDGTPENFGGLNDGTDVAFGYEANEFGDTDEFAGLAADQFWYDEIVDEDAFAEFIESFNDEDDLSTDDVTLADIRAFTRDTGATIEVDEDFFTVNYGGTSFVATTATRLRDITKAVRTLVETSV